MCSISLNGWRSPSICREHLVDMRQLSGKLKGGSAARYRVSADETLGRVGKIR
ncbi:MAG: hypothetical protein AAF268_05755 [Cyanobacteria bacterium P01_A01_bin.3]